MTQGAGMNPNRPISIDQPPPPTTTDIQTPQTHQRVRKGLLTNEELFQKKLEDIKSEILALEADALKNPDKGNIANEVMELILLFIPIIQRNCVAQTNRMTSLPAGMQALITKLIKDVPYYTKDNPRFDKDDEKDSRIRNDKNTQMGIYMDQLRAQRDLWADQAKKDQSLLNTGNEAVSQQIDMLSNLFDRLRESCTKIFR